MLKYINMAVTEEEYSYIIERASEEGVTVQTFIRNTIFPKRENDEYEKIYEKMLTLIYALEPGVEFTLKEVFGFEWKSFDRGLRTSLGRSFNHSVNNGLVKNVRCLYKREQNNNLYLKE